MRAPPGRAEQTAEAAPAVAQRSAALGVAQELLTLQRTAGNRVVGAYLARAPKVLAEGRRGNDVAALQSRLNQLSDVATALDVDGVFGPITAKAVREFKARHSGLPAGANVDAETDAAISEALTKEQDQTELARKLFTLGAASYERRKYAHAYDFFTRAGELADRPALLFSRAQALRKLGARREEAIALYDAYLLTDNPVRKADAESALKELRGPAKTGDEDTDRSAAKKEFMKGAALYERGDYAHAYDEFTIAGGLADRPALLFSRAQALRKLGGRREEAIALYEAYLATDKPVRKADAESALKELRGPDKTGDADKDTAAAKAEFMKGAGFYERGDFAHAYDEFTIAGGLADRPELLFSRAQALRKLGGRSAEAIALYEAYLATDNPTRRADAELWLDVLRTQGAGP
jgi:peptidoglycan hydrolase-like protein with peptidoglycan-binding domain